VSLSQITYNPLTKRISVKVGKMRDAVRVILTELGF
jgi:hypothetical protein